MDTLKILNLSVEVKNKKILDDFNLEIKSGEIIGTHEIDVYFENERLSLVHEAFSRRAFVEGVIQAVNIIKTLPIGLYDRENLNLWKETK